MTDADVIEKKEEFKIAMKRLGRKVFDKALPISASRHDLRKRPRETIASNDAALAADLALKSLPSDSPYADSQHDRVTRV